jgi:metal-responsive CopG/Arc/MetJ family transcriptional regulator
MTYPTISISLNDDRTKKLSDILRKLREQDDTVSRSEAIARAIDFFYPHVCASESPNAPKNVQVQP